MVVFEYIAVGLLAIGAILVIVEGLLEKDIEPRTRGPVDVLSGCIGLAVSMAALWSIWFR